MENKEMVLEKEQASAVLSDPGIWRTRAVGQRFVAEVLLARFLNPEEKVLARRRNWREVALFGAIAYHLGLALEMAAKGAIAAQTGEAPPATHDLEQLCETAGTALVSAEAELARRLAAAVAWWGRYPSPKKRVDLKAALDSRSLDFARDLPLANALLARLGVIEGDAT